MGVAHGDAGGDGRGEAVAVTDIIRATKNENVPTFYQYDKSSIPQILSHSVCIMIHRLDKCLFPLSPLPTPWPLSLSLNDPYPFPLGAIAFTARHCPGTARACARSAASPSSTKHVVTQTQ